MKKVFLLTICSFLLLGSSSCEQEEEAITRPFCDPETEICIRVKNNAGFLLRNIMVSLDRGRSYVDYSVLSDQGTSFYLSANGDDLCNFNLTARDDNDSLFTSGGWVCTLPVYIESGPNTLTLHYNDQFPNRVYVDIMPD